jgi:hypothetical protein
VTIGRDPIGHIDAFFYATARRLRSSTIDAMPIWRPAFEAPPDFEDDSPFYISEVRPAQLRVYEGRLREGDAERRRPRGTRAVAVLALSEPAYSLGFTPSGYATLRTGYAKNGSLMSVARYLRGSERVRMSQPSSSWSTERIVDETPTLSKDPSP